MLIIFLLCHLSFCSWGCQIFKKKVKQVFLILKAFFILWQWVGCITLKRKWTFNWNFSNLILIVKLNLHFFSPNLSICSSMIFFQILFDSLPVPQKKITSLLVIQQKKTLQKGFISKLLP